MTNEKRRKTNGITDRADGGTIEMSAASAQAREEAKADAILDGLLDMDTDAWDGNEL